MSIATFAVSFSVLCRFLVGQTGMIEEMQDEDRTGRQVYAITSAAVSRAIAACRPSGSLQSIEKIVVTAKLAPQQQHLHVSGASSVSLFACVLSGRAGAHAQNEPAVCYSRRHRPGDCRRQGGAALCISGPQLSRQVLALIHGCSQVAASFQRAFPEGSTCLCNTVHVRTTGAYNQL